MRTLRIVVGRISAVLALLVLVNCGPSRPMPGERSKVADSGDRPSWVKSSNDGWEKGDRLFFRSVMTDQADLSMGLEAAKARGIQEIAEQVSVRIATELAFAEEGNASRNGEAARYLRSAVAAQSERLRLQGFRSEETYWERYLIGRSEGVEYSYDIYRCFSMAKSDYSEAKTRALAQGRERARDARDRKAEDAIERLMERNTEQEG